MTKTLVTGGTGFIGSGLVKRLLKKGHSVRALDNNFRGKTSNLKDVFNDIELIEGDIRNPRDVKRAVDGIENVYHLAFINGTENFYNRPELVMEVGVRGHFNLMDALDKGSVKLFAYASSSEVYQTPPIIPTPEDVPGIVPDMHNPRYSYGGSKLYAELLTMHYAPQNKMKRIIFRPHNIYGPVMGFEHVIPQLVKKIILASDKLTKDEFDIEIQGTGKETRAFCFIKDALDGIMLAAEKGATKEIYNVGTEDEIPIIELVQIIGKLIGVNPTVRPSKFQQGSAPRRCPDISKLSALGYHPSVSLEEGLKETIAWYQNYYMQNL